MTDFACKGIPVKRLPATRRYMMFLTVIFIFAKYSLSFSLVSRKWGYINLRSGVIFSEDRESIAMRESRSGKARKTFFSFLFLFSFFFFLFSFFSPD